MSQRTKTNHPKRVARTVLRTFRLPRQLDEALVAGAAQDNQTLTDILVSILTKYDQFDRFAQKFGFIGLGRGTFKAIVDALPDDKIIEIASSNAVNVEEFIDFRFKKRDLNSLMGAIEILSKYQHRYDYDFARDDYGATITLRTDLGEKYTLFMSEQYRVVIAKVLGVAPLIREGKNQVILRIDKSAGQS